MPRRWTRSGPAPPTSAQPNEFRTSCTALLAHSSPKSRAAGIGGRPAPALCRPSACRHAQALWAEEAQTAADIGAFDQFFVRTRPPSAASSALGSARAGQHRLVLSMQCPAGR